MWNWTLFHIYMRGLHWSSQFLLSVPSYIVYWSVSPWCKLYLKTSDKGRIVEWNFHILFQHLGFGDVHLSYHPQWEWPIRGHIRKPTRLVRWITCLLTYSQMNGRIGQDLFIYLNSYPENKCVQFRFNSVNIGMPLQCHSVQVSSYV